jgi:hypothetical protein
VAADTLEMLQQTETQEVLEAAEAGWLPLVEALVLQEHQVKVKQVEMLVTLLHLMVLVVEVEHFQLVQLVHLVLVATVGPVS